VGDNLIDKVGDFEDFLIDANPHEDVFIFDVSGNGALADSLVKQGFAVLGGSVVADRLERDRAFGTEVMKSCNIEIPKTVSFMDFDKAIAFVEKNPELRFVYKPSKQLGDLSASHVSYDAEDLIELLNNVKSEVSLADPQFELQEFVKGIAFSTELWFDHGDLLPLTNHTLERKELMNDDLGPSGGCTGNIVWFCPGCPVCDVCKQLKPWAKKNQYHGMLDLNVIVAEGGIYGLEFTPRFGYDASPTLFWSVVNGELGKFFADAARGQLHAVDVRSGFGGAVRVTMGPWPTEKYDAESDVPIRGLGNKWQEKTYLYNVKQNKSGLCSAGAWGILLLFTGYGRSIEAALAEPMEMCKKVRVKNKQYRTDLVEQFTKDLRKIENLLESEVV
jgi:phosphoribosylamine--glycine ligase